MRPPIAIEALLCLLLLLGSAAADDEAPPENAEARVERLTGEMTRLHGQRKFAEAVSVAREILDLQTGRLGERHPDVLLCLNNVAALLQMAGDLEAAQPYAERVLALQQDVLGPSHPDVARSLNNLGTLHRALGDPETARPYLERALAIKEGAVEPNGPDIALTLGNLGELARDMGDLEAAKRYRERALEIQIEAMGARHPRVGLTYNALGRLLRAMGRFDEARHASEMALDILEEGAGPKHRATASALHNLGMLLYELGDEARARRYVERALAIQEEIRGPTHPDVGDALAGLALLLWSEGDVPAARALLERSLAIRTAAHGGSHPKTASCLNGLGALDQAEGNLKGARKYFEKALAIRKETLGPTHLQTASSANNLGVVLKDLGDFEGARRCYEEALATYEQVLGPRHADTAWAQTHLAEVELSLGHPARARALSETALRTVAAHVGQNLSGFEGSLRRALASSVRWHLDHWIRHSVHWPEAAYGPVLVFKGLVRRTEAAERKIARLASPEVEERIQALRVLNRRLGSLANDVPFGRDARQRWRERYARVAAEQERALLALGREFAPYRKTYERLELDVEDIQAELGPGEVLIDILRSGGRYVAWVVFATGTPVRVDLGEAEAIESAAVAFAEHLADRGHGTWKAEGRALRELILAPIEAHLRKDVRTICLCPDAALAAVPFAALPGETDDRLLGDDFHLSCISMAQDLVPWEDVAEPGRGTLLLGGVDYGHASESAAPGESAPPHALVDRAPRGRTFIPLPGTEAETRSIRGQLGKDAAVLRGRDATEARLRARAQGRRLLHFATHGFVRDDLMRGLKRRDRDRDWLGSAIEGQLAQGHDPMVLSGLALAGANPRQGGQDDDGILTALEASHLHLDGVELVVLSACQTALGRSESGEGVIGLVQGFQMAGAKQVIGSLWRVDDEATRALMVKFYELWSPKDGSTGLDAPAALRKAQEHVRGHEKWKHPYFWAAWVSWGASD